MSFWSKNTAKSMSCGGASLVTIHLLMMFTQKTGFLNDPMSAHLDQLGILNTPKIVKKCQNEEKTHIPANR